MHLKHHRLVCLAECAATSDTGEVEPEMGTIVVLFPMNRAKQSPAGLPKAKEDLRDRRERKKQKKKNKIEKSTGLGKRKQKKGDYII